MTQDPKPAKSEKKGDLKSQLMQIIRFGLIGGIAFVIDYGLLNFCTEVLHIYYLTSSIISFTVSVIFNYVASVKWVFSVDNGKSSGQNLTFFITFSIIGLLINQLIMWVGTDLGHIDYRITKLLATFIVMVFNYITRKIYFEKK